MSKGTLYNKVIDAHTVAELSKGKVQVAIKRHIAHEVTPPPAIMSIRRSGLTSIPHPELTNFFIDHIVSTNAEGRLREPEIVKRMEQCVKDFCRDFGPEYHGRVGIAHQRALELGLILPGEPGVCGDSHTSTYGAVGTLAWGIGTSQIEHVLRTQSLSHNISKVRQILLTGELQPWVTAKDIALNSIRQITMRKGIGYAHEYGGPAAKNLNMEQRFTICNLGIEGNARQTYFNPDDIVFAWLFGRERVPKGEDWEKAVKYWRTIASDSNADYDDVAEIKLQNLRPTASWGTNPGQSVFIDERIPQIDSLPQEERGAAISSLEYMKFQPGEYMAGKKINMAFIGSCTNGRLSDLEEAASVLKGSKVHPSVKVVLVPSSIEVKRECERKGLDKIFMDSGIEWRDTPGCSMCLGMNTDRAQGDVLIASTSNRNFEGRQGDTARTVLMSPAMVAYAAIRGEIGDVSKHNFN